jgi:hypothetical protein
VHIRANEDLMYGRQTYALRGGCLARRQLMTCRATKAAQNTGARICTPYAAQVSAAGGVG